MIHQSRVFLLKAYWYGRSIGWFVLTYLPLGLAFILGAIPFLVCAILVIVSEWCEDRIVKFADLRKFFARSPEVTGDNLALTAELSNWKKENATIEDKIAYGDAYIERVRNRWRAIESRYTDEEWEVVRRVYRKRVIERHIVAEDSC